MIHNLFPEELIQALGWTMIHSLWQGFAVAILMGVAMIGLQKKSAKVRYELAWFALFLVFVLSLSTFIYLYDAASEGAVLGSTITIITEGGIILQSSNTVQTFFQKTISYFNEHLHLIVTLWIVGMGFFLLRLLGGLAFIERLKSQRQLPVSENWQRTFENLLSRFPMKKTVQIAESSLAKVPMVIGYAKPIILFPLGAVNHLTQQEVEAVLAHELAHIYRNDYLLNIIQSIIEIIFYYHPAVWWISANIRTERENCCDDIAVQLCGSSLTYVKALVSLEEMQPAPTLAMSFSSGRKNQLLNRVKRILNQPQNKFNIMEKFTATCFLLLTLLLFSVSATQPDDSNLEDEQKITIAIAPEVEAIPTKRIYKREAPQVEQDTTPLHLKGSGNFVYSKDGETVEIKYENDKIRKLKINGEVIPEEDYDDYTEYIDELVSDIPAPPTPPVPPVPPVWVAPDFKGESTIRKSTDEDGNTVYIVEKKDGGETSVVTMRGGDIKVDGKIISIEGDAPVIIHDGETISLSGEDMDLDFPNVIIAPEGFAYSYGGGDFEFEMPELPELPELPEIAELMEVIEIPEIDFPDLNIDFENSFDFDNSFDFNNNFIFDTIPGGTIWIDGERMDWDELSDEEKEEHRARLSEARQQLDEARVQMKEELARVREINKEEYKQQMEEARQQMAEVREQYREAQKEQREEMRAQQEELREQMREVREQQREQMRAAREQQREARARVREERRAERSQWIKTFETQLQQDGHINDDGSFKFSMDDKKLKINGKKQSKAELEKYKELYEMTTGQNLGNGFHIGISYDGNNNRSTTISISDDSN